MSYIRVFLSLSFNWTCVLFTLCEILAGYYPFPLKTPYQSLLGLCESHKQPCCALPFIAADLHSFTISGFFAVSFPPPIAKVSVAKILYFFSPRGPTGPASPLPIFTELLLLSATYGEGRCFLSSLTITLPSRIEMWTLHHKCRSL